MWHPHTDSQQSRRGEGWPGNGLPLSFCCGAGGLRRQLPRPPTLRDGRPTHENPHRLNYSFESGIQWGRPGCPGEPLCWPAHSLARDQANWRPLARPAVVLFCRNNGKTGGPCFFGCCPSEFKGLHQAHKPLLRRGRHQNRTVLGASLISSKIRPWYRPTGCWSWFRPREINPASSQKNNGGWEPHGLA